MTDEYQGLAKELDRLSREWHSASVWKKPKLAREIATTIWSQMPMIYTALLHHKAGMKAQQRS